MSAVYHYIAKVPDVQWLKAITHKGPNDMSAQGGSAFLSRSQKSNIQCVSLYSIIAFVLSLCFSALSPTMVCILTMRVPGSRHQSWPQDLHFSKNPQGLACRSPWPCSEKQLGQRSFAPGGTKERPGSWLGLVPGQRPRKSSKRYKVEKGPGIRARGHHENITPLPRNSEEEGEAGLRPWVDPGSGSLTNLQAPVSISSSAVPAAEEQHKSQDHRQNANPHDPGPRDRHTRPGTPSTV